MQSFRSQTSTPQRPPNPAPTATTTSPSDPSASAEAGAPRPRSAHDIASSSIQAIAESEARKKRQRALEEMQLPYTRQDLERQMPRRWKVGDVYAPHDLTGVEASKWKKYQRKGASNIDMLDQLGINPLMEFRVKTSRETSCRVTKADICSSEHRHDVRVRDRNGTDQVPQ